jgi:Ankyrin repeats (3 copies)/Ankyrin repeat
VPIFYQSMPFYCRLILACCLWGGFGVFAQAADNATNANIDVEQSARELVRCSAVGDMGCVLLQVKRASLGNMSIVNLPEYRHGMTALFAAAANGQIKVMKYLMSLDALPNAADRRGQTALSAAAYGGHFEAVQLLLQGGAAINVKPLEGPTPLLAAMQSGKLEIVELLIKQGADVDFRDTSGLSPRQFAKILGKQDLIVAIQKSTERSDERP